MCSQEELCAKLSALALRPSAPSMMLAQFAGGNAALARNGCNSISQWPVLRQQIIDLSIGGREFNIDLGHTVRRTARCACRSREVITLKQIADVRNDRRRNWV